MPTITAKILIRAIKLREIINKEKQNRQEAKPELHHAYGTLIQSQLDLRSLVRLPL